MISNRLSPQNFIKKLNREFGKLKIYQFNFFMKFSELESKIHIGPLTISDCYFNT